MKNPANFKRFDKCPICGRPGSQYGCSELRDNHDLLWCYSVNSGNSESIEKNNKKYYKYQRVNGELPSPKRVDYSILQNPPELNRIETHLFELMEKDLSGITDLFYDKTFETEYFEKNYSVDNDIITKNKLFLKKEYIDSHAKQDWIRIKRDMTYRAETMQQGEHQTNRLIKQLMDDANLPFGIKTKGIDDTHYESLVNGFYRRVNSSFDGVKYEALACLKADGTELILGGNKSPRPMQLLHYPIELEGLCPDLSTLRITEGVFNADISTIHSKVMTLHTPSLMFLNPVAERVQEGKIKTILFSYPDSDYENEHFRMMLRNVASYFEKIGAHVQCEHFIKTFRNSAEALRDGQTFMSEWRRFMDRFEGEDGGEGTSEPVESKPTGKNRKKQSHELDNVIDAVDSGDFDENQRRYSNSFAFPVSILENDQLNIRQTALLGLMFTHIQEDGKCDFSWKDLIAYSGNTQRSISRDIQTLRELGLIDKNKGSKDYIVTIPKIKMIYCPSIPFFNPDFILSSDALVTLMAYCVFRNTRTMISFPSTKLISTRFGIKPATIDNGLKTLIEYGFMTRVSVSKYRINFSSVYKLDEIQKKEEGKKIDAAFSSL